VTDWMRAFWPGNNPMKELNMEFADVKEGDTLIMHRDADDLIGSIVVVERRTAQRIRTDKNTVFNLAGKEVGGLGKRRLQKPTPSDIKRIKAAQVKKDLERKRIERENEARRARPGYQAADFLTGLGALTTEELLDRHHPDKIIKAARLLGYEQS